MGHRTPATTMSETDTPRRFARGAILRRTPDSNELTDRQIDLLVTAIRNPDAPTGEILDHVGDSYNASLYAVLGRFEAGGYDVADYDPVLERGSAAFLDLTVKQRAVVDFSARHPKAKEDATNKEIARLIDDDLGVPVAKFTVVNYRSQFPDAIAQRRQWYESHDPDAIGRLGDAADALGEDEGAAGERADAGMVPIRRRLVAAGFDDLPDRNLDGLPTAAECDARLRQRRTEAGFNRSNGESPDSASGSSSAEAESSSDAGDADAETVDRQRAGRRYQGPAEGLNLAGDAAPDVFELKSASVGDELGAAYAEAVDAAGPFGEDAFRRDVTIDDRGDLEDEIRRLRMIVSGQGAMLRGLKDMIESLDVQVGVSIDAPDFDGGGDEGDDETGD